MSKAIESKNKNAAVNFTNEKVSKQNSCIDQQKKVRAMYYLSCDIKDPNQTNEKVIICTKVSKGEVSDDKNFLTLTNLRLCFSKMPIKDADIIRTEMVDFIPLDQVTLSKAEISLMKQFSGQGHKIKVDVHNYPHGSNEVEKFTQSKFEMIQGMHYKQVFNQKRVQQPFQFNFQIQDQDETQVDSFIQNFKFTRADYLKKMASFSKFFKISFEGLNQELFEEMKILSRNEYLDLELKLPKISSSPDRIPSTKEEVEDLKSKFWNNVSSKADDKAVEKNIQREQLLYEQRKENEALGIVDISNTNDNQDDLFDMNDDNRVSDGVRDSFVIKDSIIWDPNANSSGMNQMQFTKASTLNKQDNLYKDIQINMDDINVTDNTTNINL